MSIRNLSLILFAGLFLIISCKHDPLEPTNPAPADPGNPSNPDPNKIYFKRDILPILVSNCAIPGGCHDGISAQKGHVLDNYTGARGIVKPGDPDNSEMYELITESDPDKRMPQPPKAPLSAADIDKIKRWIQQGATDENPPASNCDTTNVKFAANVEPIFKANCQGACHGPASPSGGFSLVSHAEISNQAVHGKVFPAISHATTASPMPKGGQKLSECQIRTIKIWIDAGAPNN